MNENKNMKEVSEFLDDLPNAMFELVYDLSSGLAKFTYVNNVAKKFLQNIDDYEKISTTGIKLEQLLGSPEQLVNLKMVMQKLLDLKEITIKNQEYIVNLINNKKIIIQTNFQAKFIDNSILVRGNLIPKSEIIEDKIDQQRIKEEISIEKKAENLRSFFENFDAIIMILNEEGCIQFISPDVGDNILYKPREEIIGRKLEGIFPQGQSDFFYTHFKEAIDTGETIDFEYHLPIENKLRWFQSRIIPVLIKDGKFMQVVAIIRDITRLRVKPIVDF